MFNDPVSNTPFTYHCGADANADADAMALTASTASRPTRVNFNRDMSMNLLFRPGMPGRLVDLLARIVQEAV